MLNTFVVSIINDLSEVVDDGHMLTCTVLGMYTNVEEYTITVTFFVYAGIVTDGGHAFGCDSIQKLYTLMHVCTGSPVPIKFQLVLNMTILLT